MPFQFLCPQGHLLEGVESQMGQQCQCPVCGLMFIVPTVGGAPPAAYGAPPALAPPPGYGYPPPGYPPAGYPGAPGYPPPQPGYPPAAAPGYGYPPPQEPPPAIAAAPAVEEPPAPPPEPPPPEPPPPEEQKPEEDPNRIVRIPCPQGHELHTPMSMVGMDAMCPECGAQFTLLYENSIEAREEREAARQRREELMNKRVLQWAIGAAVVVGLGLITMILIKLLKPASTEEQPSAGAPASPGPANGAPPATGSDAGGTDKPGEDQPDPADDGPPAKDEQPDDSELPDDDPAVDADESAGE